MTKDEAKAIIEREPVGGADCYDIYGDSFYSEYQGEWYGFFNGKWEMRNNVIYSTKIHLKRMSKILAIALGDEK